MLPRSRYAESHAHLYVTEPEFDVVATEIATTLFHVGVPAKEQKEFMNIIESRGRIFPLARRL